MNLKNILVKGSGLKPKNVVYDKGHGVSFDIVFLSKSEMQRLMSKNTKMGFNTKTHQREEEIDGESLRAEIINNCVKGWHGVTYKWLSSVLVIDTKDIDINTELEFSVENVETVFAEVYGLDTWLLDTVKNASNFSTKVEAELKN